MSVREDEAQPEDVSTSLQAEKKMGGGGSVCKDEREQWPQKEKN